MDLTEIEQFFFVLFFCGCFSPMCAWVLYMRSVSIAGFIQGNTFAVITDERPFSTRYLLFIYYHRPAEIKTPLDLREGGHTEAVSRFI